MPNLNGFPTDSSSSNQLKYDIVTSKFMTGAYNHQMRNAPAPSPTAVFGLVGAVVHIVVALITMIFAGMRWICKQE